MNEWKTGIFYFSVITYYIYLLARNSTRLRNILRFQLTELYHLANETDAFLA